MRTPKEPRPPGREHTDYTYITRRVKSPYLVIDAWGLHDSVDAICRLSGKDLGVLAPQLGTIVATAAKNSRCEGVVCAIQPRDTFVNWDFVLKAFDLDLCVVPCEAEGDDPRAENVVECALRASAALSDPFFDRITMVGYRGPLAGLAHAARHAGKELTIVDFAHAGVQRYEGVADEVILLGADHIRRAR